MHHSGFVEVPVGAPQTARSRATKLLPILQWLPQYSWRKNLRADCRGGLIIGCVLLAQSLAHAELSGVALIHGPYSCLVPPVVYMVFGSSQHGSVGTGGLVALVTGAEVSRYKTLEARTQAAVTLSLMVGVILVLMGALRFAGLVRFISRPGLGGFVTASALVIIASQLPSALGRPDVELPALLAGGARGGAGIHLPTAGLSACSLALLLGLERLQGSWKRSYKIKEFIVMVAATVFSAAIGIDLGVAVVGDVPVGLPGPALPCVTYDLLRELLPGALVIAVVVFVSSFAAAKHVSMHAGYPLNATNELLGLGFANALGAIFGAIPVQIGLSRTGIARAAGIKTQIGVSLGTAVVMVVTLLALTPFYYYMPKCALNCVVIAASRNFIDFRQPRELYGLSVTRRDLNDLCVWLTSFVVVLAWGPTHGMVCAMVVSIALLVLEVTEPNLAILGGDGGKWRSTNDLQLQQSSAGILVIRVDGALFYANAERFQEQVHDIIRERSEQADPISSVIFDFSCIPFMDFTVIQVLLEMLAELDKQGVAVRIANAVERTRKIFEHAFKDSLGQRDFYIGIQEAFVELQGTAGSRPRGPQTG